LTLLTELRHLRFAINNGNEQSADNMYLPPSYAAGNTRRNAHLLGCASFIERYIIGIHFQRRCQARSMVTELQS